MTAGTTGDDARADAPTSLTELMWPVATERLLLRLPTPGDASASWAWRGVAAVQ